MLQVIKNGCLPIWQQLLAASKFGLVPNMTGADVLKSVLFHFLCANQCALYMLVLHRCSHCHKNKLQICLPKPFTATTCSNIPPGSMTSSSSSSKLLEETTSWSMEYHTSWVMSSNTASFTFLSFFPSSPYMHVHGWLPAGFILIRLHQFLWIESTLILKHADNPLGAKLEKLHPNLGDMLKATRFCSRLALDHQWTTFLDARVQRRSCQSISQRVSCITRWIIVPQRFLSQINWWCPTFQVANYIPTAWNKGSVIHFHLGPKLSSSNKSSRSFSTLGELIAVANLTTLALGSLLLLSSSSLAAASASLFWSTFYCWARASLANFSSAISIRKCCFKDLYACFIVRKSFSWSCHTRVFSLMSSMFSSQYRRKSLWMFSRYSRSSWHSYFALGVSESCPGHFVPVVCPGSSGYMSSLLGQHNSSSWSTSFYFYQLAAWELNQVSSQTSTMTAVATLQLITCHWSSQSLLSLERICQRWSWTWTSFLRSLSFFCFWNFSFSTWIQKIVFSSLNLLGKTTMMF